MPVWDKKLLAKVRLKITFVALVFALAFTFALVKAGLLQLGQGKALRELAQEQATKPTLYLAGRGGIYDRNGYLLAQSVAMDSVYVEPKRIKNPAKTARLLANVLQVKPQLIAAKLDARKSFAWVSRRLEPPMGEKIQALHLPGVGVIQEDKRFYPAHTLMGQLLGTVSVDGEGQGGIEQAFHAYLKPSPYKTLTGVDARGKPIRLGNSPSVQDLAGNDVYLTLDYRIQYATEMALQKALVKTGAKAAWAIVMQPRTGDILAVANVPLANPNEPTQTPLDAWRNRALAESFEPGSTLKLVTLAAALKAGVVTPNSHINCENGIYQVGHVTIRDVGKKQWLQAAEILKYSSNVGAYKIAALVGKEKIYQMMKEFGFGGSPGLNIAEEARGQVSSFQSWGVARFVNVSFGYGVMVSALQLANMVSTIANDGMRMPTHLVQKVKNPWGDVVWQAPSEKPSQVLPPRVAKALNKIMVEVTETGGTGHRAQIPGVQVAGKSGTAEKVDEQTGRYNKRRNRASFIGFAPANDPQIAAVVVIDEPAGIAFGGHVAAPAWQEIVEQALILQAR